MSDKNTADLESNYIRPHPILPKTISSADLLGCTKQIFILHEGDAYQLRITKLGKLILTK